MYYQSLPTRTVLHHATDGGTGYPGDRDGGGAPATRKFRKRALPHDTTTRRAKMSRRYTTCATIATSRLHKTLGKMHPLTNPRDMAREGSRMRAGTPVRHNGTARPGTTGTIPSFRNRSAKYLTIYKITLSSQVDGTFQHLLDRNYVSVPVTFKTAGQRGWNGTMPPYIRRTLI